jgi:hypothetical protein
LVGQSDSPGKEVNADGLKERGFGKSFWSFDLFKNNFIHSALTTFDVWEQAEKAGGD